MQGLGSEVRGVGEGRQGKSLSKFLFLSVTSHGSLSPTSNREGGLILVLMESGQFVRERLELPSCSLEHWRPQPLSW